VIIAPVGQQGRPEVTDRIWLDSLSSPISRRLRRVAEGRSAARDKELMAPRLESLSL
jgi:hypothetical protein